MPKEEEEGARKDAEIVEHGNGQTRFLDVRGGPIEGRAVVPQKHDL